MTSKIEFLPLPAHSVAMSPEDMLDAAIENLDAGKDLAYCMDTRPRMRDIVLRLARYLSPVVPGRKTLDSSLFEESVALATREWRFSFKQGAEPARQTAYFLRGLLAPLPYLQQLTIKGVLGTETRVWDPTETSLMRWSQQFDGFPLVFEGPPNCYWNELLPVDFRLIVATRFLCTDAETLRLAAPYCDFIIDR